MKHLMAEKANMSRDALLNFQLIRGASFSTDKLISNLFMENPSRT